MAWIEIHQSLFTHRKTLRMAELLDLPEVYVAAHLVALWTWALDNAHDARLPESARIVARAAQWQGEPEDFVQAALEAEFFEVRDGRLFIHDWDQYAGKLLDRRAANADRQRRFRERRTTDATGNDHAAAAANATSPPRNGYITVTSPLRNGATVHNTTEQYPTEPEEDGWKGESEGKTADQDDESGVDTPATSPAALHVLSNGSHDTKPLLRPVPKSKSPPAMPEHVKAQLTLQRQVLQSAEDLQGRTLTKAQERRVLGWFNVWKGQLTGDIVLAAEGETAGHTDGECLDYFTAVMQRMIERPNEGKPERREGGGAGQQGRRGAAGSSSSTASTGSGAAKAGVVNKPDMESVRRFEDAVKRRAAAAGGGDAGGVPDAPSGVPGVSGAGPGQRPGPA